MSTSSRHVVVIGGGVIGAACAYYLSRAGWQVTIIDKGGFGSGCSHGNCGFVCSSHVLPWPSRQWSARGWRRCSARTRPWRSGSRMDPAALVVALPFRHAVQPSRHGRRRPGHSAALGIVAGAVPRADRRRGPGVRVGEARTASSLIARRTQMKPMLPPIACLPRASMARPSGLTATRWSSSSRPSSLGLPGGSSTATTPTFAPTG